MDFRQLSYFEAVCRNLSFTKASEELHVSQPSVTMSVHKLEESLGVQLIKRQRGGILLTAEGALLFEKAKRILRELNDAERELRRLALARKETLRIGYSVQMRNALRPLFCAFEARHEDVRIVENESSTPSIAQQLKDGLLDLGVVVVTSKHCGGLEQHPLYGGEVHVCMSAKNPLSQQKCITLEELEAQPLVALSLNEPKNSYIFAVVQEAYSGRQIILKPQLSFLQLESFYQHIESNEGVGFTYRDIWYNKEGQEPDPRLVERPLVPPCRYRVAAVHRRGWELPKVAKDFLQEIKAAVSI